MEFKWMLAMFCLMLVIIAGILLLPPLYLEQPQGTITISRTCLENGNELYLIDNRVMKSCDVDIDCFGVADEIYVSANIFDCDGQIKITFNNSSKIIIQGSRIKHDIRFLEIEEFVFTDTETMDDITVRGD